MVNISLFPFHKRKDINTERCKVTQALLSPQLRLSCRTVTVTPGAALPAQHCSTTDSMFGVFIYRWPILLLLVLKACSLRHSAQPVSTSMRRVCGWWGQHHPGDCAGSSTYTQTWCGQRWGSWGAPGPLWYQPLFPEVCSQPGKTHPWQKHSTKGQSLLVFPPLLLFTSQN